MIKEGSPLLSVIIPCYNVELFVEQAINSIINQTYKNLEIWIIDDGSTDSTLEKINTIKDERIKVCTFKNNTQKIGAVNEVLQKTTGDFIAFQDSDDWSEPERIQEQLNEFIKDTSLGICFTSYRNIEKGIHLPKKIALTYEELKKGFLDYDHRFNHGFFLPVCGSMMISKSVLNKTRGYHPYFVGKVAEDIHWIYRILKHFRGITVDKYLYNYRKREGSFTQIQSMGIKPKLAYSWQLLSKIIHKDIHEGIDVLDPANENLLHQLELEACEDALSENIQLLNNTRTAYINSMNFKIGKLILSPARFLKLMRK